MARSAAVFSKSLMYFTAFFTLFLSSVADSFFFGRMRSFNVLAILLAMFGFSSASVMGTGPGGMGGGQYSGIGIDLSAFDITFQVEWAEEEDTGVAEREAEKAERWESREWRKTDTVRSFVYEKDVYTMIS